MKKIEIFDTTLRDGEQSPGCSMTLEQKVLFAKKLEELNVDIIEAGFAASSDADFNAIQKISLAITKPIIVSLARCNKNDIDKAYESLKYAKRKRIHVFIATSKIHMENKLHMNKEEVLINVRKMVKYAKSLCDDIEFSLEDATRTDKDFLIKVIITAINSGANVINIPDTVGYIQPDEYKKMFEYIKNNVKDIDKVKLSTHCHNDLGLATANTLSAIESGVSQVECTVNGIGERAGNAALEQIVTALKVRKDYYNCYTDINMKKLLDASQTLVNITGSKMQRHAPIIGENAFKHEAGIHQHGVLENKNTYEIINTEDLGIDTDNIVIGKHSGKHAIINKLKTLGISFNNDYIDSILNEIKEYASNNGQVPDDVIIEIASKYKIKKLKNIM